MLISVTAANNDKCWISVVNEMQDCRIGLNILIFSISDASLRSSQIAVEWKWDLVCAIRNHCVVPREIVVQQIIINYAHVSQCYATHI